MAIKKLQNDYTTEEQSKRLLELGVPADSANCYINDMCDNRAFELPDLYSKCNWRKKKPIPCWSVGRLIEIDLICNTEQKGRALAINYYDIIPDFDMMEWCINEIEDRIERGVYDFSRLEV